MQDAVGCRFYPKAALSVGRYPLRAAQGHRLCLVTDGGIVRTMPHIVVHINGRKATTGAGPDFLSGRFFGQIVADIEACLGTVVTM